MLIENRGYHFQLQSTQRLFGAFWYYPILPLKKQSEKESIISQLLCYCSTGLDKATKSKNSNGIKFGRFLSFLELPSDVGGDTTKTSENRYHACYTMALSDVNNRLWNMELSE